MKVTSPDQSPEPMPFGAAVAIHAAVFNNDVDFKLYYSLNVSA
jgi:hypothetical protein